MSNLIHVSQCPALQRPDETSANKKQKLQYKHLQNQCCYDHRTFTVIAVVGYHRTDTAIVVFYSVLGGLAGRCFLKTASHYSAEQVPPRASASLLANDMTASILSHHRLPSFDQLTY